MAFQEAGGVVSRSTPDGAPEDQAPMEAEALAHQRGVPNGIADSSRWMDRVERRPEAPTIIEAEPVLRAAAVCWDLPDLKDMLAWRLHRKVAHHLLP